ncbi:hypothetical protein Taro_018948 [Colocasia esculenta]|uniref:Myb-like domain-containing protein n=1 Tax=Colocasia esculenta TaxID=4460 RepID=A0A843US44_COLES|nr:hypothetical protein [Colocasia esculenta]
MTYSSRRFPVSRILLLLHTTTVGFTGRLTPSAKLRKPLFSFLPSANPLGTPLKNDAMLERKAKVKKKLKKTKFKSLKKGSLSAELEGLKDESASDVPVDNDVASPEVACPASPSQSLTKKKRKKSLTSPGEEKASRKSLKKLKKASEDNSSVDAISYDKRIIEAAEVKSGEEVGDFDVRHAVRSMMGKISITAMPVKRVMVVKPEKVKKRGNVWSKDCIPSPDSWSSQEDAILCAVVHEYGTNWSLVSDALYSMTAGGFYRGRFRHAFHCCERFRELFFKYVSSGSENSNAEKFTGSGKAMLKVTEDQVGMLLKVASEQADVEFLLQKHFTTILSSVWRAANRHYCSQSVSSFQNGFHSDSSFSFAAGKKPRRFTEKMNLTTLRESSKIVATVFNNIDEAVATQKGPKISPTQQEVHSVADQLDLVLELPSDITSSISLPSVINVSICSPPQQLLEADGQDLLHISSYSIAEDRFRMASEACFEGEAPGWATSAFPTGVGRFRSSVKSQSLGKHKSTNDAVRPPKSKAPRIAEPGEPSTIDELELTRGQIQADDDRSNHLFRLETGFGEGHSPTMDWFESTSSDWEHPHEYDPSFISNLEELGSLPDITDIG